MTVVLDLDGTLIASFTPRRAPRLPPGATSYIVGRGGRLNPAGVFVVERPGLQEFFARLSEIAGKALTCLAKWHSVCVLKHGKSLCVQVALATTDDGTVCKVVHE
jgi:NLI interacting factor-like phosphatase